MSEDNVRRHLLAANAFPATSSLCPRNVLHMLHSSLVETIFDISSQWFCPRGYSVAENMPNQSLMKLANVSGIKILPSISLNYRPCHILKCSKWHVPIFCKVSVFEINSTFLQSSVQGFYWRLPHIDAEWNEIRQMILETKRIARAGKKTDMNFPLCL
jgi:hypothetical protein